MIVSIIFLPVRKQIILSLNNPVEIHKILKIINKANFMQVNNNKRNDKSGHIDILDVLLDEEQ